jgi:hypothetical protein
VRKHQSAEKKQPGLLTEYWLEVSGVLALVGLGLWYSYIGKTFISPEVEVSGLV